MLGRNVAERLRAGQALVGPSLGQGAGGGVKFLVALGRSHVGVCWIWSKSIVT